MKKLLLVFCSLALFVITMFGSKPNLVSPLTSTAVLVSTNASNLSGYSFSNPNPVVVYVQLFDAAASTDVTVGVTVPKASVAVPAYGVTDAMPTQGLDFRLGLVVAATTTAKGSTPPTTAITANFYTN